MLQFLQIVIIIIIILRGRAKAVRGHTELGECEVNQVQSKGGAVKCNSLDQKPLTSKDNFFTAKICICIPSTNIFMKINFIVTLWFDLHMLTLLTNSWLLC